jgi:elongation factor Ts
MPSASDVKKLRDLTGAGMLDCKKALDEASGDFDRAVELLRIQGAKGVGKREGRVASNGLVTYVHVGQSAVLLELACETDFVAKTADFQDLANRVANLALSKSITDLEALNAADLDGTPVQQVLDEANATMGEKIEIRRFALYEGANIEHYLHKSDPALPPTLGVIVQTNAHAPHIAKDVAQQVAAMSPQYVTRNQVPADEIERERRVAEETAREEGKPEAAMQKIIDGRVASYFKDVVLEEQPWVKDPKQTIGSLLETNAVSVERFARFRVGQP